MHQKNRNRVYKFQSNKEEKTNKKQRRKNEEKKKLDAFELWCWKRLLRGPWTARRSNQSILKEIILEHSLEGLMLKFQYFGHMMKRANSLEKTMMLGKTEGKRRRGQQRMMVGWHHRLNGHEFEQTLGESEGQGSLARCSPSQGRDNQPALPASEASLRLTERPAWVCPHDDILTWHIKQPLLKFVWFFLHQTHAGQPSPFKTASHCSPRGNKMGLGMVLRYHSKDKPHITKSHHKSYCLPYKSAGWIFLL